VIYALNVYDVIDGKESVYATYAEKAAPIIDGLGITVVAAGDKAIREISGQTRNHFVVVQFANVETFDALMAGLEANDLHRLREEATENYIWTLYKPWGFGD